MRVLHEHGYEFTTKGGRSILRFPFQRIADALMTAEPRFAQVKVPDPGTLAEGRPSAAGDWSILEDTHSGGLTELAAEIVRTGARAALRDVPLGRFGALLTVDRREIESFRSIRTLIAEYAVQRQQRPLSIAVFGAPGQASPLASPKWPSRFCPGRSRC
jgi:hypothetical protein